MPGKPLRVLIVEDSRDDALLVLSELRRGGYQTEHLLADSQPSFLDALQANWDVIISDFSMPRFDGLKAFEHVLDKGMDVPFIFVSGHIGEERAADAVRRGASDYILKDNLARLVPAVDRELRAARERRRRRAAEEALVASDRRYSSLVDPSMAEKSLVAMRELLHSLHEFTRAAPYGGPSQDRLPAPVPGKGDAPKSRLSPRQLQVLTLIAEGKTTKKIASDLGVTEKTAGAHRLRLMEKIDIHDTAGLVRYAIRHGLIRP